MLPALLTSCFFLAVAYVLRRFKYVRSAWVPLGVGILILLLTLALKVDMEQGMQGRHDVTVLLRELGNPALWDGGGLDNPDAALFLASTASHALALRWPDADSLERTRIDTTLGTLAARVSDRASYPAWRNPRSWDDEAFFLAHTAITLARYQAVTGRTHYAEDLQRIGRHLGQRLQRGRYKHFRSRPSEQFYRPTDNAAVLYALHLHDQLFGTPYAQANFGDWTDYLRGELYYEESRLPCAAFNATDRCHLEPNATTTGLYVIYRALADPSGEPDVIPYREWLHYFKGSPNSPISLRLRPNLRKGEPARFCDLGAAPLGCDRHERSVGLWAARLHGGEYARFRLYAGFAFNRWFRGEVDYGSLRTGRRIEALTEVALRGAGGL